MEEYFYFVVSILWNVLWNSTFCIPLYVHFWIFNQFPISLVVHSHNIAKIVFETEKLWTMTRLYFQKHFKKLMQLCPCFSKCRTMHNLMHLSYLWWKQSKIAINLKIVSQFSLLFVLATSAGFLSLTNLHPLIFSIPGTSRRQMLPLNVLSRIPVWSSF